jgi:hypothetical protein
MNYSPGDLQDLFQDPGIMKPKEEGVISPLAVEAVETVEAVEAMEAVEAAEVMRVNPYLRVGPVCTAIGPTTIPKNSAGSK